MTAKKDAKMKKLAKKKKNKIKKSGQDIIIERLKSTHFGDKLVVTTHPEQKMSEILLDFAEPLLDSYGDSKEAKQSIISLASIAWNAALLPNSNHETKKLIAEIVPDDEILAADMVHMVSILVKRKEEEFADINRFIVDFHLTFKNNDDFHLDVASTPISISSKITDTKESLLERKL